MRVALVVLALASLCACAVADEAVVEEDLTHMTKEQLISALQASKKANAATKTKLMAVTSEAKVAKAHLAKIHADRVHRETARVVNERKNKGVEKKARDKKRNAKLKAKGDLAELMMTHGAKFLAFKVAEDKADKGSIIQTKLVLAAAKRGARAAAVKPLKKVARHTAVQAVKAARADAKKKHIKSKSKINKLAVAAASKAVDEMLKTQDSKVEGIAKKYMDLALKKFPPAAMLAEDDATPNHFTAPPAFHVGGQAAPAKAEKATSEDETQAGAGDFAAALLGGDSKEVPPTVKKEAAKAPKKVQPKKVQPKKVQPKKVAKKMAKKENVHEEVRERVEADSKTMSPAQQIAAAQARLTASKVAAKKAHEAAKNVVHADKAVKAQ